LSTTDLPSALDTSCAQGAPSGSAIPDRELGVDVYRGVVVMLMIAAHAARLTEPAHSTARVELFARSALGAVSWAEPYVSASFVFLVGYSMVLSRKRFETQQKARPHSTWLTKLLVRAVFLYGLSVMLFVAHYGYELPDVFVSPGILSVIAAATIIVGLSVASLRAAHWLLIVTCSLLSMSALLEQNGTSIVGLNAGEGALLPALAFAPVGALTAFAYRGFARRGLLVATLTCGALCAVALASGAHWLTSAPRNYTNFGAETWLRSFIDERAARLAEPVTVFFWNHTTVGSLGLVLALVVSQSVLLVIPARALQHASIGPLVWLGRHALVAYVTHLGALGLLDAFAMVPAGALATWALVLLLAVLSLSVARVAVALRGRAAVLLGIRGWGRAQGSLGMRRARTRAAQGHAVRTLPRSD